MLVMNTDADLSGSSCTLYIYGMPTFTYSTALIQRVELCSTAGFEGKLTISAVLTLLQTKKKNEGDTQVNC